MLIETNTSPTNTIYFLGSQVIELFIKGIFPINTNLEDMYRIYIQNTDREIGIVKFIYVLDWLFMIGVVELHNSYITFKIG